jgi:hypothetical protein
MLLQGMNHRDSFRALKAVIIKVDGLEVCEIKINVKYEINLVRPSHTYTSSKPLSNCIKECISFVRLISYFLRTSTLGST